ncbi:phosphopantetheine-binding protein [Streptomyces sp. NPDC057236]|uniref:phosphopantetheine-binding protein n=1 Tax=Streptomyces sp. NPDC057236 TaxID=3346059 RepID=UPI0036385122
MPTEWDSRFEKVLRAHLPLLGADRALAPDAALSGLGLDSLASVQLLVSLEETFEVAIPDEMLTPENFATPGSLWTAVDSLREPR